MREAEADGRCERVVEGTLNVGKRIVSWAMSGAGGQWRGLLRAASSGQFRAGAGPARYVSVPSTGASRRMLHLRRSRDKHRNAT